MDTKDIERYFGSRKATMAFLAKFNISRQRYSLWTKHGIPVGRQLWLEKLTCGALKADDKWSGN